MSRTANMTFARDLPMTQRAVAFAEAHHAGQRRSGDGAPFMAHPLEVASLLESLQNPDHVIASAVLHDVIEDTDAQLADIEASFGAEVAELVGLVTDDASIADEERRKDDVRDRVRQAGGYALAIYAADKISKVRELRMLLATGADGDLAATKLHRYRKCLDMLEAELPGSRLVQTLRFELESLQALPPQR